MDIYYESSSSDEDELLLIAAATDFEEQNRYLRVIYIYNLYIFYTVIIH